MPPDNTGYMIAAYVIVAAVLLGYAIWLFVRIRKLRNDAKAHPPLTPPV